MGMKILLLIIGVILFLFSVLDIMNKDDKLGNIMTPLYELIIGFILFMLGIFI